MNPSSDPNTLSNPKTPLKMGLSAGWVILLLVFVLPPILKPYRAQKEVSTAPGFFDQRLLDPAKSIAELENLKTQYPDEPALLEKLAYVYAKEIRTSDGLIDNSMAQQSIETYRHLIRVDPSRVGAYNNLANIYYTTGKIEEALSTWKEALSIKPDFIDAHLNLGKILYSRGQLKEAAQHFEHVLKIDPSNSEAIVYLKRMVE
jgi:tetratricopeptide (TPR) repeat protein